MEARIRATRVLFEQEQVGVSSKGEVRTADGRTIDFTMDLTMDRSLSLEQQWETLVRARPVTLTDPLVISLDGLPPRLSDSRFSFDLDGDGTKEQVSFVSQGSGFLAFDRNMDGRINDGSELFGPASGDGFRDLGLHDQDMNGWIDEGDEVFSRLTVWTRDEAGQDRLVSLKEAGIGAIFLGAEPTPFDLKTGDNRMLGRVAASGMFLFEDGRAGTVQQIDLAVPEDGGETAPLGAESLRPMDREPSFTPVFGGMGGGPLPSENPFAQLTDSLEALKKRIQALLEGKTGGQGSL
jgi:hypothetical protein